MIIIELKNSLGIEKIRIMKSDEEYEYCFVAASYNYKFPEIPNEMQTPIQFDGYQMIFRISDKSRFHEKLIENKVISREIAQIIENRFEFYDLETELYKKQLFNSLMKKNYHDARNFLKNISEDVNLYIEYAIEYTKDFTSDFHILNVIYTLQNDNPDKSDDFIFKVASHFISIGKLEIALKTIRNSHSNEINRLRAQIIASIAGKPMGSISSGSAEDILLYFAKRNYFL